MKKIIVLIISIAIMITVAVPAYAGNWKQTYNGWQYIKDDGSAIVNQWFQDVDGKWYHFDYNGNMQHDKWIDRLYYLGSDGAMLVNSTAPNGMRLGPDGTIVFNPNTGTWLKDDIGTWYREPDGSIARNCVLTKRSTGEKYYINESGYLMTDEELEEYYDELANSYSNNARKQLEQAIQNQYQSYVNQIKTHRCTYCDGTGRIYVYNPDNYSIPSGFTSSENVGKAALENLQRQQNSYKNCPYCNGLGFTY